MKLKYYLRGMGIGIILTAIVMGFALGGRKAALSDAEIIQRAKVLGMVEAGNGVLTQTAEEVDKTNENDTSASDQTLDQKGEEVSEEIDQGITDTDQSVQEVDESTAEGKAEASEEGTEKSTENTKSSSDEGNTAKAEDTASEADTQTANAGAEEESTSQVSTTDTATAAATTEPVLSDNATPVAEAANTSYTTGEAKTVTIPGGLGSDQVAQILYREGVVDNAVSFNKYLIDRGVDRIIRSGVKTIPAGATYEQIAGIITKG